MYQLTKILNRLPLKINKIITAFLLGTILLVTTACNSGDELGARPKVLKFLLFNWGDKTILIKLEETV